MHEVALLLDAHAAIAESLLWEPGDGVLFWADIKGRTLHRLDLRTLAQRRWTVPEDLGAFALMPGRDSALVALRSRLFALSLSSGALRSLAVAPWDPVQFRYNEGAVDHDGRFWVGCMFDPPPGHPGLSLSGPLQRYSSENGLALIGEASACHNGMAWSPDRANFYLADSPSGTVWSYALSGQSLGPRTVFLHVEPPGIPDGAAVDEEGAYWCAIHGAGAVHRVAPDGRLLDRIALPVSLPTMCAFAGDELRTLIISSASDQLTPAQRAQEKLAGALFLCRPGVRGLPKPTEIR